MKRRRFLVTVLTAAALLALAERLGPRRWVEAVRARIYPGPVVLLDKKGLRSPGKWAG